MAGDPRAGRSWHLCRARFNPRPPSMAGDPSGARSGMVTITGFNPRPPSMAGDPASGSNTCSGLSSFQSAPAIDGGRSLAPSALTPSKQGFNPRPPSMAGDPPHFRAGRAGRVVSIRARHRWRAIPTRQVRRRPECVVSIRARHRWRAIPSRSGSRCAGRWFQSAPAIDGGRSRCGSGCPGTRFRFNPRPPSMAGDPGQRQLAVGRCAVSIRARHRWRAIPAPARRGAASVLFQSAPAIDGGRSASRAIHC